jgi:hypothetical protein
MLSWLVRCMPGCWGLGRTLARKPGVPWLSPPRLRQVLDGWEGSLLRQGEEMLPGNDEWMPGFVGSG